MKVAGLEAKLTLDATSYMDTLTKANIKLQEFSTTVNSVAGDLRQGFGSLTSVVKTSGTNLNTMYRDTAASIREVKKESMGLRSSVSTATESATKAATVMKRETSSMAQSMKDLHKNMDATMDNASKNMQKNANIIKNLSAGSKNVGKLDTASTKNALQSMKVEYDRINRSQRELNTNAKKGTNIFFEMKRMVSGILFAQSFYKGINAIQNLVSSVYELQQATETATMSFGVMLKDADSAKALTTYLEDFAATSSFSFETASNAAKKLLAYGFELQDMDFMLNTVGDATAAMGDPESFGRIAKALGQIKTNGKLVKEELNQLAEAGIPAFQILEEELGITKDQLSEIGKEGISADVALQALTTGMQKRFGGAMKAMSTTTSGMISNISESILILGKAASEDIFGEFKLGLIDIVRVMDNVIATMRENGIGKALMQSIGPEAYFALHSFALGLVDIGRTFMATLQAALPFLMILANGFGTLMQVVGPALQFILQGLQMLGEFLLDNTEVLYIFFSALVIIAVGFVVYKAVAAVSVAIAGLTAALATGVGAVTGFAGAMATLKAILTMGASIPATILAIGAGAATMTAMMSSFGKQRGKISTAGMVDKKALQGMNDLKSSTDGYAKSQDDFNDGAGDTIDNIDKIGNSAKESADKMKNAVASFDEVFTLPDDPDETKSPTGGAGVGDIGGIAIPDIGMPDMGGVNDWLNQFGDLLKTGVKSAYEEAFKPQTMSTLIFEQMKLTFSRIGEFIAGIFGVIKTAQSVITRPIFAVFQTITDIFTTGGKNVKDIWRDTWADIQINLIKANSDLKKETTNGLNLVKTTSAEGLLGVKNAWQIALGALPDMTYKNMDQVATLFVKNMETLDDESLTILRGTSDSMAVLFNGIKENMSEEEAFKMFTQNLKLMKDSGMTDVNQLTIDFEKAMKKIQKNAVDYSTLTKNSVEKLFGSMKSNVNQSSEGMAYSLVEHMKNMSIDGIEAIQNMGGTFSKIFDGITADSDLESAETRKKVTANIEKLKADGVFNIDEMEKEIQAIFDQLTVEADAQMKVFAGNTDAETLSAANFANANAKQIAANIHTHLAKIPGLTDEEMLKMKTELVDGLVANGIISGEKAEQIKRNILTPIDMTPGGVEQALIDVGVAINKQGSPLNIIASSLGKLIGSGIMNGVIDKLEDLGWNIRLKVDEEMAQLNADIAKNPPKLNINASVSGNVMGAGGITVGFKGGQGATGKYITAPSLMMVGEGGRDEALLPLEDNRAMTNIGEVVGSYVAQAMMGGMQMQQQMNYQNNIGTMNGNSGQTIIQPIVASDQALRELWRKLQLIGEIESQRRLGTDRLF